MADASERMPGLLHEAPAAAIMISGLVLAVSVWTSLQWQPSIRGYPAPVWTLALLPAFLLSYHKRWRGSLILLVVATVLLGAAEMGRQLPAAIITWKMVGIIVIVLLAVSLGAGVVSDARRRHALNALKSAHVDEESGLPNRLVFEIALEKEFVASSWGRTFSVALIEVGVEPSDNAPRPKEHGPSPHLIGVVLKCFARSVDLPCRYGENTFAVLLPGAGLRRAIAFSRQAMCNIADQVEGANGQVKVSCGVARLDGRMTGCRQVLQPAESALHIARSEGGSRVCVGHYNAGWLEAWLSGVENPLL